MIESKKVCKVCGFYYQEFYPWGKSGEIPSHDICDCCGIEFGYEDNTVESTRKARQKWINNGAIWNNPEKKPKVWDLRTQFKNIPKEFLDLDEKH